MLNTGLKTVFLFVMGAAACSANTMYKVSIDTSSLSGQTGAIYFQFAGGLNSDLASISITSFSIGAPGGLIASPPPFSDGGVTGSLDTLPLMIDNSEGLNDYEHYLTYGPTLAFNVSFNLPAVLTGNSGSELLWQLTSSDGLTPVLTNDGSGNMGDIFYDQTGAFTAETLGNDKTEGIVVAPSVPEPATWALLASALAACWRFRRR